MKTITIHVSEPVYREFQEFAKKTDRKTSQLIRDAMDLYRKQRMREKPSHSLLDHKPISLGKPLKPWKSRAELLENYFDRD